MAAHQSTTVTIRLKPDTREWLTRIGKKEDRTLSYLIRRIVEERKAEEESKQQNNAT